MSLQTARGVVVSLYADATDPDFLDLVDRLTEGTPFRLVWAEPAAGGTARCMFEKRTDAVVVGGGNFVDLLYRLQRSFDVQGGERTPSGVLG
jgi:hypothetical protein